MKSDALSPADSRGSDRGTILAVQSLGVRFGGLAAVKDLSFDLKEREILGLIGPNGAGKTTCFNALSGIIRPTSGVIHYRGEPCTGARPYEMAKRGLVRTFQLTNLFHGLTAEENIMAGGHLHAKGSLFGALFQTPTYRRTQAEARQRANAVLRLVGLESVARKEARALSFGQQRRLEIGIALAAEPTTLLLDEPAAGMNQGEAKELMGLVLQIRAAGTSVLLIEHNMRFVMELSERIVVMNFGEKLKEGAPQEIADDAQVREVYLGRGRVNAAR